MIGRNINVRYTLTDYAGTALSLGFGFFAGAALVLLAVLLFDTAEVLDHPSEPASRFTVNGQRLSSKPMMSAILSCPKPIASSMREKA